MVRNKLHWDANNAVGLPKQRNSYQSCPTFLCFKVPLRHLRPSAIYSVPCDRILQRAYSDAAAGTVCCRYYVVIVPMSLFATATTAATATADATSTAAAFHLSRIRRLCLNAYEGLLAVYCDVCRYCCCYCCIRRY